MSSTVRRGGVPQGAGAGKGTADGSDVATEAVAKPPTAPVDRGTVVDAQSPPTAPRRARLELVRLDPWSVMKVAGLLSVALAIVALVAIALLWWVLNSVGVFDAVNRLVTDLAGSRYSVYDYVGFGRVMRLALGGAVVEVVLVTALATLGSFLYNLVSGMVGGLDVTLQDAR